MAGVRTPANGLSEALRGTNALRHLKSIYVQVLIAIALGILVGALWPKIGVAVKPLGDGFIKLIKLVIAPVIFCTVAGGIARMGDIKAFGRVGLKALLYFEVVSTLALVLGLLVGRTLKPGAGFNIDPKTLDPSIAAGYLEKAKHGEGLVAYLLHLIPDTFFGAFSEGTLLQVLLIAMWWCAWRRWARSGPWASRSASTGSAPWSSWGRWWRPSTSPRCCSCWWCWV
jgi:Na+/H+-dicarboxylate symporter